MKHLIYAAVATLLIGCSGQKTIDQTEEKLTILAGSYAAPGDTAIRLLEFDPETANLRVIAGATEPGNASYFAEAEDGIIYGVSEGPAANARAWALRVDPESKTGNYFELIDTVAIGSSAPCYISISPDGRFAVTANYDGATVTVLPIDTTTKAIGHPVQRLNFTGSGPMAGRQENPHPHCATFTPDGDLLLVNDLGTDKISLFEITADADTLVVTESRCDVKLNPGSGPRHIVFDNEGKYAYLINELSDSLTILSYSNHTLTPQQYIAANKIAAHGAADIHMSPDGKYVYTSLRLAGEGIACFSVDSINGGVEYSGFTPTNEHPRNFMITPDGSYLLVASRDSGTVEVFERDEETGALLLRSTLSDIPGVVCLKLIDKK